MDILVEGTDGRSPVADRPLGWLATTVTLYDALERGEVSYVDEFGVAHFTYAHYRPSAGPKTK